MQQPCVSWQKLDSKNLETLKKSLTQKSKNIGDDTIFIIEGKKMHLISNVILSMHMVVEFTFLHLFFSTVHDFKLWNKPWKFIELFCPIGILACETRKRVPYYNIKWEGYSVTTW